MIKDYRVSLSVSVTAIGDGIDQKVYPLRAKLVKAKTLERAKQKAIKVAKTHPEMGPRMLNSKQWHQNGNDEAVRRYFWIDEKAQIENVYFIKIAEI